MFRRSASEMRVVILAPIGRDAQLLASTVNALGIDTAIAPHASSLLDFFGEGAGSAIIAEESLTADSTARLTAWVGSQPPWSDIPLIILTNGGRPTRNSQLRGQALQMIGNVTLIERPVRPETIESAVRAALRARMRQYEIRSRQEALLRANADLEQFAHSASHDLREPLRSIGLYSDLLLREYDGKLDSRGGEFLNLIGAACRRMDALLTDLLAYAHASSISADTVEIIDSRRPLDSALENLASAIRESNAEIEIGGLPAVKMHESHLAQVFQNLLGNAIKYRSDDNRLRIRLTAETQGNRWMFRVEDNGIGVPPAYRETIFGIFKRLHTNARYSGTGMGLAICQRIVERYRGRIWVESEPGSGSTFCFTVPA